MFASRATSRPAQAWGRTPELDAPGTFGGPPSGGLTRVRRCVRKWGGYGWKPSSSSNFSIRVFRAYPPVETRQTVPCRAIRGNSISVNGTLPSPLMSSALCSACPAAALPWSSAGCGNRRMFVWCSAGTNQETTIISSNKLTKNTTIAQTHKHDNA